MGEQPATEEPSRLCEGKDATDASLCEEPPTRILRYFFKEVDHYYCETHFLQVPVQDIARLRYADELDCHTAARQ